MKARDKYASSYAPAQVRQHNAGVPKHIHYRCGDRVFDAETSRSGIMVYFDEVATMPVQTRRNLSRYERKQAKAAAARAKKEARQLAARYRDTVGDAW